MSDHGSKPGTLVVPHLASHLLREVMDEMDSTEAFIDTYGADYHALSDADRVDWPTPWDYAADNAFDHFWTRYRKRFMTPPDDPPAKGDPR